jgi:uncharacterized protein (TIRG00374 family)
MTTKKILRLALGMSFALFFSWLILRQIKPGEIQHAFSGADPSWIVASVIAFIVGYVCRIERWRKMFGRDNPTLKWRDCAGPFVVSFATNNVLPFRAGDALRSFTFKSQLGVSSGVVIATLFVERLLDLLTILILLGLALAYFGVNRSPFAGVGGSALIAVAGAILLALLFPRLFQPIALALGRLVSVISPNFGIKVGSEINKCLDTLKHLAQGNTMLKLIAWSLIAWLSEGGTYWFSALAFPSITEPSAAWLAIPVGSLATLIPSAPGYVGTFDYFCVRAMTELGNSTISATAFTILVHTILWLPPTVAGGLYLLLHPIKLVSPWKVTRS